MLYSILIFLLLQVDSTVVGSSDVVAILSNNWVEIVSALIPIFIIISRLTPTKKDDKIVGFIVRLLEAIPDNKKGGGKHDGHSKKG